MRLHEARQINPYRERESSFATADLIWAAGLAKSKGEAKRLLIQSAVQIDQNRHLEYSLKLRHGAVIQVGRRRFARLTNLDEIPVTPITIYLPVIPAKAGMSSLRRPLDGGISLGWG